MFRLGSACVLVSVLVGAAWQGNALQSQTLWQLIWSDEFDGPARTSPDPSKWGFDIGNGGANPGWGNAELQEYSASPAHAFLDGAGHLIIRADRTSDSGFASARIKTQGRFEFQFGRVEARLKIPYALGVWPALWMLGDRFPDVPWPDCGEIDIMENFGPQNSDASRVHAAVHGPGYSGAGIAARYDFPPGQSPQDFHIYAIEWDDDAIVFFVDGVAFRRVSRADLPAGAPWVFSRPFFIIANVAVGGAPAPVGYPDETTPFPQDMVLDYVRVYQAEHRN